MQRSGLALFSVLALASACGDDRPREQIDAAVNPPAIDAAPPDTPPAPVCEIYPVPSPPDEDAEAQVRAALQSLVPGATLLWAPARGTLTFAGPLALPLPGCVDGQELGANVLALLGAHRDVFQIDPAEWQSDSIDCRAVGTNLDSFTLARTSIGGLPGKKDVFVYFARRVDGVVTLASVSGTYLPPATPAVAAQMAACGGLPAERATAVIRGRDLQAEVLSFCDPDHTITYRAKAGDVVEVEPMDDWQWEEGELGVSIRATRRARLVLDHANFTDELIDSNARCPVPDSEVDSSVGFRLTLDGFTGEILDVQPGLDCVVC